MEKISCAWCEKIVDRSRIWKRFCSEACRMQYWRYRPACPRCGAALTVRLDLDRSIKEAPARSWQQQANPQETPQ